jgi:hypothetical protein
VLAVRQGNQMSWRVAALLILVSAKTVWWIMEQPHSSLLELHESMQYLFRVIKVYRFAINMSEYGARSQKRTLLYSSLLLALAHAVLRHML